MRHFKVARRLSACRLLVAGSLALLFLAGCSSRDGKSNIPKEFVTGERVSIMTSDEELKPDPRVATITVRLPEQQDVREWPQPGGNETNVLHHVKGKADLKKIWKTGIGKGDSSTVRLNSSPVIADGKVYAMDTRSRVTALDAKSGKRLWRKNLALKGEKSAAGFGGGVAFGVDRVFVTTGFGRVHALDAQSGEEVWVRDFGVPFHTPPSVATGRVFANTVDNQLHALSAFDGVSLWSHRAITEPAGILSDANPAIDGDIVIAPFSSGEVVALRAQNGQQAWADQLTSSGRKTAVSNISSIAGRPAVQGGQIIAISHSGRMVAIDLRSGERFWTRSIGGTQAPWISGEFVYVVDSEARVICVTRRDGRIRWIAQLERYKDSGQDKIIEWNGPILTGNQLVLFSSHGRFIALSPYTGAVLQVGKSGGDVNTAPVVADGIIYVLNAKGDVVAFEGQQDLTAEAAAVPPESVNAAGVIDATKNPGKDFWEFWK